MDVDTSVVFSSEMLLQQAVAGLLSRMPDHSSVKILQGTLEFGKDLVFYARGGFGETILSACVVKNTKITGNVAKASGARTVLTQAEQAFDSPYIDEAGEEASVGRVYIISPYEISQHALMSIRGRLKERSGQVVFVCGSRLFDLFKEHWPDFLADEADAIARYLSQVRDHLEYDNPLLQLTSLYSLGTVDARHRKIYVQQRCHRDLRAYTLGLLLTDSIPDNERLRVEWRREDVRITVFQLKQLEVGLTFLNEWGYFTDRISRLMKEQVSHLLPNIVVEIDEGWHEGAQRKYGVTPTVHDVCHQRRQ